MTMRSEMRRNERSAAYQTVKPEVCRVRVGSVINFARGATRVDLGVRH